uniref:Protein XRP2 n=1 Tax=Anisakis simplex TaxID=6269 RepID=A0A0M3K216_ANISI
LRDKERPDPSQYQFTNLHGEVVAKLDGHVNGQQFIIDKCKECCILVLDHTACVNIDDCEKCLIVLGPCKGSVFVRDCANCTIFTISQQFRSRDCSDIDVFIFCSTRPIIESCRLMRFRPLALFYDKLEGLIQSIADQMLKASISPFTNNWSAIHDFTPEKPKNFQICPMCYDTIKNMELVNNIEEVKFNEENSLFPPYFPMGQLQHKAKLLLFEQLPSQSIDDFYRRIIVVQKELISNKARIVATRDVTIRKGDMYAVFESKNAAKYSGRIVSMEVACDEELVKKYTEYEKDGIQVVDDKDFDRYRTSLHRLADIQMNV